MRSHSCKEKRANVVFLLHGQYKQKNLLCLFQSPTSIYSPRYRKSVTSDLSARCPSGLQGQPWVSLTVWLLMGQEMLDCSPTTPEDPEVAFPLRLGLKILRLLWSRSPWVIVMEGGRKQLFLPSSLLITHLSYPRSLVSVSELIFLLLNGKLSRQAKKTWTQLTSLWTGTPMTWRALWNQRCNKCHLSGR